MVEVGVGLIPGGGGTKEFAKRVSDSLQEGDVELNALQNAFMNIATAKVALSAEEAREMNILRPFDRVSINRDRQRTSVDLPEPESPMTMKISPSCTSMLARLTAPISLA